MMHKLLFTAALGVAALGLSACDDYGYGGVAVGYGAPGYYGYDDPYYGGVGPGAYGGGYFGWYGDYYYPGSGYYVYDQYRRPYRWNDNQRRYWEGRRGNYRGQGNWGGFNRGDRPGYQGRPGGGRPGYQGYPGGDRPGYQGRPGGDRPGYQGRPGGNPDGNWSGRGRGDWQSRRSSQQPGAAPAPQRVTPGNERWAQRQGYGSGGQAAGTQNRGGGDRGGRGGWRGRRGD